MADTDTTSGTGTPPDAGAPPAVPGAPPPAAAGMVNITYEGKTHPIPAALKGVFDNAEKSAAAARVDQKNRDQRARETSATELTTANTRIAELEASTQALEDEKLSEAEKAAKQVEREAAKNAREMAELKSKTETLENAARHRAIDDQMRLSVNASEQSNPEHTLLLLKAFAPPELVANGDGYKVVCKVPDSSGGHEEMSPEEAAKYFLGLPGNSHLLKSSVRTGAGTTEGGHQGTNGKKIFTKAEVDTPQGRAIFTELEKAGGRPVIDPKS